MSFQTPNSQFPELDHSFWRPQRTFGIFQGINGGIDFGVSTQTSLSPGANQYTGNINGQWANVTAAGVANTEFAVPHSLGRIPSF